MGRTGATEFCARCAAESEVQIHSLCSTLCGKESSLSLPYLQLWVLIGNWIYYALKSHLEVWEGMTAPASPTQMDPDRRATSNGRARSVPSVSATGGIRAISATPPLFEKNRNSDVQERCSTAVPQMFRATTAHLLSFFHINVVGPCPHFIKSGPSPPRTGSAGDTPQRHAPRAARVLRVPSHVGGPPVAQERVPPDHAGPRRFLHLGKDRLWRSPVFRAS